MNSSQIKACQSLLESLIDTNVLASLIRGGYFNKSEFKIIKRLVLENLSESELANSLESYHPVSHPNNKSNQLFNKLLGLVPLQHIEFLDSNSSWIYKSLNFIMQSAISDYLSRMNKSVFNALKKAINPKSIAELNYDQLSIAQFEIANIRVDSKNKDVAHFETTTRLISKRFYETEIETQVSMHYNSLFRHFHKSASLNAAYAEEAQLYYNKYVHLIEETDNIKVYFFVNQIGIINALLLPDYQLLIDRCKSSLHDFQTKFEFRNDTFIRVTRNRLVEGLIQVGQYNEALEELNKVGKLGTITSKVRQASLRILIYVKNDQHLEAVELFFETDSLSIRKKLKGGIKYNFDLIRNIVYIIAALKGMDAKYLPDSKKLKKMLSVDSEYYRDKSGLNLAQIVTKWVLLIMIRDTGTMERSVTALNKYLSRHIRDKQNYRAKCMIRMLLIVHSSNYHVPTIKRRTSISYNRLKQTKPDGTLQAMELEMISYEQLWHMLLDYLAAGKRMYT